jgi:hypothetical protein
MVVDRIRHDMGSAVNRAATIVMRVEPLTDDQWFRAVGLHVSVMFDTGDGLPGFADLSPFPSETLCPFRGRQWDDSSAQNGQSYWRSSPDEAKLI